MISVGVGYDSMRNWTPWIDIKITRRAVQAVGCDFKKIGHDTMSLLSGGPLLSLLFSDMLHYQQPGIDSHRIQMERSVASHLGRPPALFHTFSTLVFAGLLAAHSSEVGLEFRSHTGWPPACTVPDFLGFGNSGNSRSLFSSNEQLQQMN
jgi:hypothetical protein|tara:strand:- start:149 stop:598 length:450 start_codon:yes stop_codon:yes gene_type:complete